MTGCSPHQGLSCWGLSLGSHSPPPSHHSQLADPLSHRIWHGLGEVEGGVKIKSHVRRKIEIREANNGVNRVEFILP